MNRHVTALAASAVVGLVMLTAWARPPSAGDRSYRGMLSTPTWRRPRTNLASPAGAGALPLTITLVYAEGEGTPALVLE